LFKILHENSRESFFNKVKKIKWMALLEIEVRTNVHVLFLHRKMNAVMLQPMNVWSRETALICAWHSSVASWNSCM